MASHGANVQMAGRDENRFEVRALDLRQLQHRRMSSTAAHLVDRVIAPDLTLRQWVLTVPFELRLLLAAKPDALSAVGRLFVQEIQRWQRAEQLLLSRYGLSGLIQIADIGCGSGEITSRLAALYPEAQVLGIDILESSLAYARQRHAALSPRVQFEAGDAFQLALPSGSRDLVVCRH